MPDPQDVVSALMAAKVAAGVEQGLQVAAYLDGELIVDATAGVADASSGRPVAPDTLFTLFSCSKGITSTVIHHVVEQGLVDYDDPVAEYWPEFGRFGKDRITLRHVLTHTSGVRATPWGVDYADWDAMCWAIALMEPEWEPGTAVGYSGMTFGYIVAEMVRQADGRPFGDIARDDVLGPVGLVDLHFGVPAAELSRVAALENDPSLDEGATADYATRFFGPRFNEDALRMACMPAGGVIGSARALAGMYAALIPSGLGGERILPEERLRIATMPFSSGLDRTLGRRVPRGLGYQLGARDTPIGPSPRAFGHTGHGGSVGFADPEHGLAFALAKNRLSRDPGPGGTAQEIASALLASLGIHDPARSGQWDG